MSITMLKIGWENLPMSEKEKQALVSLAYSAEGDPSSWMIPADTDSEVKEMFNRLRDAGHIWNAQTISETPPNSRESRPVGKDPEGNYIYAEYVKQFYVIRELNRLYPGWSVKDFKLWYESDVQCWVASGVLHVRYYDVIEKKFMWREIPGVGAQQVVSKKADERKAFKPDDMAKSPRTDMIKNCAYWLGIAFDVYSREIPLSMRRTFENIIRDWKETDYIKQQASQYKNVDDFRAFLNDLPKEKHTNYFLSLLDSLIKPEIEGKLWEDFSKQNKDSVDRWLKSLKESNLIRKEESNEKEKETS